MRILLFGGTTEGRVLSECLAELGAEVTVSVATEYGREELAERKGLHVVCGRKTRGELTLLLAEGFDLCVDSTHPYAVEVTENVKAACEEAGVPYRRCLRRESRAPDCLRAPDAKEAARLLQGHDGNILLTTGAKELPHFGTIQRERLFVRVLPTRESIAACEEEGVPHRNIVAMQGPFTRKLNEALLEQYRIAFLVTKDGGRAGGFPEKVSAARACGVKLIVIGRPRETGSTVEEILDEVKEMLSCGRL